MTTTTYENAVAVLKRARQLLKQGWTQGAYHRHKMTGMPFCNLVIDEESKPDKNWEHCIMGAVFQASRTHGLPGNTPLTLIREVLPTPDIASWNDQEGRTHAEVLAAIDRAVEAAKAYHKRGRL